MHIFKYALITFLLCTLSFAVSAQDDSVIIKKEMQKKRWLDNNLYTKEDALDFIKLTYESFTSFIGKKATETGIYSREIKLKGCELRIETHTRLQESSYKGDRTFEKTILLIYLDQVVLEGNQLKSKDTADPHGLFLGYNYAKAKSINAYSILTGAPNPDARFVKQNYEEHLQWAFQFLIDECKGQGK